MPTRAGAESGYNALQKKWGEKVILRYGNGGGQNWNTDTRKALIVVCTNGWLKAKLLPFCGREMKLLDELGNVQAIILDEYHLRYAILNCRNCVFVMMGTTMTPTTMTTTMTATTKTIMMTAMTTIFVSCYILSCMLVHDILRTNCVPFECWV